MFFSKVEANIAEATFFQTIYWILIQRLTLPLLIFFHFHSAVVFIELFKEVFDAEPEDQDGDERGSNSKS